MKLLRLNSLLLALALAFSGCAEKKKPVLVMPQQPPPTATPQATPTPVPAAETTPPQEPQNQAQPSQPAATEQSKTQEKTKSKSSKRAAQKKPSPSVSADKPSTEVARNTPPKKVIQEPAKPETPPVGQISPGPTPASTHDQASTEQLLQSAESNLNGIKRQLTPEEENMRAQIKEFISQSHKATAENDPARAHTLAVKARLLSDDLVKQR
ncbi:MAG TPA: hypothetical protein VFB79_02600 [Candidatus Angelobacter sp.]|nr:hypothetical protein [Candidatus Angelobacter sp.]